MKAPSAETRESHREYWHKVNQTRSQAVEHFLEIGRDRGKDEYQGARMVCEFFAAHQIDRAIQQAQFLANHTGNDALYGHMANILGEYKEILPLTESQVAAIVFNLCGDREFKMLFEREIPNPVSDAIIALSGRRNGFLIERIEQILVTVALAMRGEGK